LQCDSELTLTGFQGELRQVISNLVRNSLDAVCETGSVTLRASAYFSFNKQRRMVRMLAGTAHTGN
jgi:signal transduction histidine kinase